MTTQDTNNPKGARRVPRLVAIAALTLAVVTIAGPTHATTPSGLSTDRGTTIAQSPLIPKKTRHILNFSRWGIA